MKVHSVAICFAFVLLIVGMLPTAASAAAISPIGATSSAPLIYGSTLAKGYDGLLIDPTSFVAIGSENGGVFNGPYTVKFDLGLGLGLGYDLTAFDLWNNGGNTASDGEGVRDFTLTFYNPSSAQVGSVVGFNGASDTFPMQTFSFAAVSNVKTVDFTITSNALSATVPSVLFSEVKFEGSAVPPIPVPGALLLAAIGTAGVGGLRRFRNAM